MASVGRRPAPAPPRAGGARGWRAVAAAAAAWTRAPLPPSLPASPPAVASRAPSRRRLALPPPLRAARAAPRHRRTVRWRRGGSGTRGGLRHPGASPPRQGSGGGRTGAPSSPRGWGRGRPGRGGGGRDEAAVPSRCRGTARQRRGARITGGAAAALVALRRERGGYRPSPPPGGIPAGARAGGPRPPRRRDSLQREPARCRRRRGGGSERGSERPLPAAPRTRVGSGRAVAAPSRGRRCPGCRVLCRRRRCGRERLQVRSGALPVLGALPARSGSAVRHLLPAVLLERTVSCPCQVIERVFCFL